MRVGDYARSETYGIIKIEKYYLDGERVHIFSNNNKEYNVAKTIFDNFKSSPNIIDLIEFGDYVNRHRVSNVFDEYIVTEDEQITIDKENIKSIVTHEQFESMEYKIGE